MSLAILSIEGIGAIIAGLFLVVYLVKKKEQLKRFILRRFSM